MPGRNHVFDHLNWTITLLVAFAGAPALAVLGNYFDPIGDCIPLAVVGEVTYCLLVVVVGRNAKREGFSWAELGIKKPDVLTLGIGIGLAVYYIWVHGPLALRFAAHFGAQDLSSAFMRFNRMSVAFRIFVLIIGVPSEEFLYRSYGFARLSRVTGNPWIAGLLVCGLFGLAHIPLWGWALSLTTAMASLVATAIYIWRRDVLALTMAHLVTDAIGLL